MATKVAIEVQIKNIKQIKVLENQLKKLRKEQRELARTNKDAKKLSGEEAKAYTRKHKAVTQASKALREHKKALLGVNKNTKAATKSTNGMAKQFVKGAAAIGIVVGAFRAINRVVSGVISTFTEFEFQMAKTAAITGATESDFKKLGDTAQELGRTTFFTAQQVAELQTNYAKLGFSTDEILKAQASTLQLATVTASDLGRAAIVSGAAVRGFGLDASETGRVVDVMTEAFNSSALDMEKWQTSMTKVAPIAAGMNITIEDTAAIMGVLTDAGIEASIAGTSMRNIFLQMKDPTSKLGQYLGFTVNSSLDLKLALEKLSEASAETRDGLVNIRQVAAMQVMVQGAEMVQLLSDKLYAAKGAAEKAASIIGDTLHGAFLRLKSAAQGLSIELVDKLGGGLQEFVDKMAGYLNALTKSSDGLVKTIKFLVQAVKWIGLYKIGTMAATIAINATRNALLLFNGTLKLTRTAMARTGIGALVVGLGYLAEKLWFSSDATDNLTDATENYRLEIEKTVQTQERLSKALGSPLPLSLDEVPAALKETEKFINAARKTQMDNKVAFDAKYRFQTLAEIKRNGEAYVKMFKEDVKALKEKDAELTQIQYDFGIKKIQILGRQQELQQKQKDDAYTKDVEAELDRNSKQVQWAQQQYLKGTIDKEAFTKKILELEQTHFGKMIKVNKKHNKETRKLEDSLLKHKIANFETLKKKTKDDTKHKEEIRLGWEKVNMMKQVLAGTKSLADAERELRDLAIDKAQAELDALPVTLINGELRLELEQKLIDLKMKNRKESEKNANTDAKLIKKTVREYSNLGSALQEVAGENESLNGIREAGIAISKAAAIAESILTLNKSYQAIVEGKLNLATMFGAKAKTAEAVATGVSTTATIADTTVTGVNTIATVANTTSTAASAVTDTAAIVPAVALGAAKQTKLPFPFNIIAVVATLALLAKIMGMFEKGGIISDGKFAKGGMVRGPSHAEGGVKFAVGGKVNELEGGEAVINKRSTAMFRSELSSMNEAGGGVKFASGGLLNNPSFAQQKFSSGMNRDRGAQKVYVVEADISQSQNSVSVLEAAATI